MNKPLDDLAIMQAQTLDDTALAIRHEIRTWHAAGMEWDVLRPAIALETALEDFAKGVSLNREQEERQLPPITTQDALNAKLAEQLQAFRDKTNDTANPEVRGVLARIESLLSGETVFEAAPAEAIADLYAQPASRRYQIPALELTLAQTPDPLRHVHGAALDAYGSAQILLGLLVHPDGKEDYAEMTSFLQERYDAARALALPQDETQAIAALEADVLPSPASDIPQTDTLGDAYALLVQEAESLQPTGETTPEGKAVWAAQGGARVYEFTPEEVALKNSAVEILQDALEDGPFIVDGLKSLNAYFAETLAQAAADKQMLDPETPVYVHPLADAWQKLGLTPEERVYLAQSLTALGLHPDQAAREAFSAAIYDAVIKGAEDQHFPLAVSAEEAARLESLQTSGDTLAWLESAKDGLTIAGLHALGKTLYEKPYLMPDEPFEQDISMPQVSAPDAEVAAPVVPELLPERAPLPNNPVAENLDEARAFLADSLAVFIDRAQYVPGQLRRGELAADHVELINLASIPLLASDTLPDLADQRDYVYKAIQRNADVIAQEAGKALTREKNEDRRALWLDVQDSHRDLGNRVREFFIQQTRATPILMEQLESVGASLPAILMNSDHAMDDVAAARIVADLSYRIQGEHGAAQILAVLNLAKQADAMLAEEGNGKKFRSALLKENPLLAGALQQRKQLLAIANNLDYHNPHEPLNGRANAKKYTQEEARIQAVFADMTAHGGDVLHAPTLDLPQAQPAKKWLAGGLAGLFAFTGRKEPRARIEPLVLEGIGEMSALPAPDAGRVEPVLGDAADEPLLLRDDQAVGRPLGNVNAQDDGEPLRLVRPGAEPEQADEPFMEEGEDKPKKGMKLRDTKAAVVLGKGAAWSAHAAKALWRRGAVIGLGAGVGYGVRTALGAGTAMAVASSATVLAAPAVAAIAIIGGGVAIVGGATVGAFNARLNTLFDENTAQGQKGLRATANAFGQASRELFTLRLLKNSLQSMRAAAPLLAEAYKAVKERDEANEATGLKTSWAVRRIRTLGEASRMDAATMRMALGTVFGGAAAGIAYAATHMLGNDILNAEHRTAAPAEQPAPAQDVNTEAKGDRLPARTDAGPVAEQPAPAATPTPETAETTVQRAPAEQPPAVTQQQQPPPAATQQQAGTQQQPRVQQQPPAQQQTPPVQEQQAPATQQGAPAAADAIAAATTDAGRVRALMQLPEMQEALAKLSPAQQRHFGALLRNAANRGSFTSLNDAIDNISEGGRIQGNTFTRIPGLRPDRANAIALRTLIQQKLDGVGFDKTGYGRALALNNDHLAAMEGRPSRVGAWVEQNRAAALAKPAATDPAALPDGVDPLGDLIRNLEDRPGGDSTAGASTAADGTLRGQFDRNGSGARIQPAGQTGQRVRVTHNGPRNRI